MNHRVFGCVVLVYIFLFQLVLVVYFLNPTKQSQNKFAVVEENAQVHRRHLLIFLLLEQPRARQIREHKIKQLNRRQKIMSLNQVFDQARRATAEVVVMVPFHGKKIILYHQKNVGNLIQIIGLIISIIEFVKTVYRLVS